MTKKENNIILFSITLCWASSYLFMKDLPIQLSSFAYLTLTTGIAGIILFIVFFKKIREITFGAIWKGFLLSLFMVGNLLAEKAGINLIPASNASFIYSLNIIFVPLLLLCSKIKPSKNNMAGIGIILCGLLISNGFQVQGFLNRGTFYMVAACLLMAFYTLLADKITKEEDPLLIGIIQMWFTAGMGFLLWFIEDPATFFGIQYTNKMLSSIFMLAFFAKAYAYIMLMYSQKYTDPIGVTIIAATEPVITVTLAVLLPGAAMEEFHITTFLGAMLIALGAVVAGTKFLDTKERVWNEK